jgi:PAS domain S-box-containing protein
MQVRYHLGSRVKGMEGPPFTMMFAGVLVAAWFGGAGPGIVATLLGAGVSDYMFIEPRGTLLGNNVGYDLRLFLFIIEGFAVSWLVQALRRSSSAVRQVERNLRLIADNTSDVIFAYDMSRQLIYVNPAFETLTGSSINELRENGFMNYVHPDDSPRMLALFEQVFAGKSFRDVEYRIIANDGQVKWCRAAWGPLVNEYSNQVGVQGRETEITEQKQSEGTLRFLAEAAPALAGASDAETMLNCVARLAVRQFADWCAIDLIDATVGVRTIAAAHADANMEPWLVELQRDHVPALDALEGRGKVLRTGQPEIVPSVSPEYLSANATDARHFKLLHNLAPRSIISVPLKNKERVGGAITFVSGKTQRRYDADDLIFATDLAARIAVAIETRRQPTHGAAVA